MCPEVDVQRLPSIGPSVSRAYPLAGAILHAGCRWVEARPLVTERLPHWLLLWSHQPGMILEHSGGRLDGGPDRLLVVGPGTRIHRIESRRQVQLYVHLSYGGRLDHPRPLAVALRLDGYADRLVGRLATILGMQGPVGGEELAVVWALAGWVLAGLPADAWRPGPEDGRVERLCREMDQAEGPWTDCSSLAAGLGLSRSRLVRLFTAQTGLPPHRYQIEARLRRAAHLLLAEGPPLRALAQRLGFVDRSHLSRRFRARFGLPPGRWLRAQRRG